jgi:hypothetical protein
MKDVITLSGLSDKLRNSTRPEEFISNSIDSFKRNESLFKQFLYWYIYNKIEILLIDEEDVKEVHQTDSINDLLPKNTRKAILKNFEMESDLILPRPVMSTFSFILLSLLVLIPVILVIYFAFLYPETLPFIFELFVFSGGVILIFTFVILIHFLKPELLASSDLPRIKNYDDFVKEALKINEHLFRINEYQRTVVELGNLYLINKGNMSVN